MTLESKKRIFWIDIAKAFSILCIVFGHTLRSGIAQTFVYSFHVPTFFLLSGATFKEKTIKEQLKYDFQHILIPYYSFGFLSILIFLVLGKFAAHQLALEVDTSLLGNIFGLLYANPAKQHMKFNLPLWFLPCLFITKTLYNILCKLLHHKNILLIGSMIIAAISFICSSFNNPKLPFNILVAIKMLLFFSLGQIIIVKLHNIINIFQKNYKAFLLGAVLISITAVTAGLNPIIDYATDDFHNIPLFLITSITGCFGVCLFSIGIGKCKVIEYVGKKSLSILVMHKFPILLFQTVGPFKKMLTHYDSLLGIIIALFISVVAIIMCLFADSLIRKIAPFLFGDFSHHPNINSTLK